MISDHWSPDIANIDLMPPILYLLPCHLSHNISFPTLFQSSLPFHFLSGAISRFRCLKAGYEKQPKHHTLKSADGGVGKVCPLFLKADVSCALFGLSCLWRKVSGQVSHPAELWIQRVVKATANLKENNTTWDTYLKENKRRKFKENNTTTATNLKEN